jgi:hypothetical protein
MRSTLLLRTCCVHARCWVILATSTPGYRGRPYHNIMGDHSKWYHRLSTTRPFPVSIIHVPATSFYKLCSFLGCFLLELCFLDLSAFILPRGNTDFSLKCPQSLQLWFLF